MTEKFQTLEKGGPKNSIHWNSSLGPVWVAAFVSGICFSAVHAIARCLLRQGGEELSNYIFLAFVVGFIGSIALYRLPRICNLASASWLAAALAFAAGWIFKLLPYEQLWWGVAVFDFGCGALLGVAVRASFWSLLAKWIGVATAQMLIKMLINQTGYTTGFYVLGSMLAVLFLVVAALQRVRATLLIAGVAALGIAAFTAPVNLSRVNVREGWTFARRKEGVDAAVTLIEKATKPGQPLLQQLILDNRHIIAGQLGFGEKRLGHLPLLMNPAAKNILFLNVNGGVSAGAAKSHVQLERIDIVEPLAEVASFLPAFAIVNDQITEEPRAKLSQREVGNFMRAPEPAYDVIVANPIPPSLRRSQEQFSSNFYSDVKKRLTPGGVFVQWLPLYQLDEANLKTIIRTFVRSFDGAQGFIGIYNGELPVLGLFARNGGALPALADIQKILQPNPGARAFVADTRDLLGSRLFDSAALSAFVGEGSIHSIEAPALKFDTAARPQDAQRGGALLRQLITSSSEPHDDLANLGSAEESEAMHKAIATRCAALRRYLLGDILRASDAGKSGEQQTLNNMVSEYLAALDIEPDFQLARHMLLAQTVMQPSLAETILQGLLKHTPDDPALKQQLLDVQNKARQKSVNKKTP